MVCAIDDNQNEYYFVIDRGAHGKFKTKIRIIYTGKISSEKRDELKLVTICDDYSPEWAEIRGKREDLAQSDSELLGTSKYLESNEINTMRKLFDGSIKYAQNYGYYSPYGENCQHFATGIYNTITGEQKDISNWILSFKCRRQVTHSKLFRNIEKSNEALGVDV